MSLQSEFPDRIVQLADGRPGLRGSLVVDVHEPDSPLAAPKPGEGGLPPVQSAAAPDPIGDNSCNPCLDFVSSDETLDRYDEIISASGWQLATYQRNPVFQNAHQYGDIIFTLGKALITEVRSAPPSTLNSQPSPHLFQRIQFATDVNPMARIAYGLYRGKFLNAVSVGFIPLRWEDGPGPEKLSTLNPQPSTQQFRRRYIEQELLEVSAVGIPANPNALALAYKCGAVEKTDLQETADLLRAICATAETHGTHGTATGPQPSTFNPQLLKIARELRDLLRH